MTDETKKPAKETPDLPKRPAGSKQKQSKEPEVPLSNGEGGTFQVINGVRVRAPATEG